MEDLIISIVIPCFNAEKTLIRTLDSVMDQKYKTIEVIIVDDGSTDGTSEIIKQYEKKYSFVKSIAQQNKGVSAARNNGVKIAKGNWIAFLDADDIFYKNSLTDRVKVIKSDFNVNMLGVFCRAELIFANGRKMGFGPMFGQSTPNGRVFFSLTFECLFPPSTVIVNKKHFLSCGGFDETISPAEDYDLWHRMMRSGRYFQFVRGCKIGYTQHPGSAVRSKLLTHYHRCKTVAQRIASPSEWGIEECREGFAQSHYHISLTQRALSTAFMAIATGQYAIAQTVLPDISFYAVETLDSRKIESLLKFSAIRALCRHERDWFLRVWPEIYTDVVRFFEELDRRFEGKSQNVKAMLALFEENRYRRTVSIKQEDNPGSILSAGLNRLTIVARVYVWDVLKGFVRDRLFQLVYHEKRILVISGLFILYSAGIVLSTMIVLSFLKR